MYLIAYSSKREEKRTRFRGASQGPFTGRRLPKFGCSEALRLLLAKLILVLFSRQVSISRAQFRSR
jgi:hypothetical protein